MKRKFILALILVMVAGFSMQAHAALENLGVDDAGNRLIYDSALDITWYDYSNSANTWQNQVDWADALSVDFGGNVYDDWRLPFTVDGVLEAGNDGTTTGGLNITSSEMGHLYYAELGNTAGEGGFVNSGDFQNLQSTIYWSGTDYSDNPFLMWQFAFSNGNQGVSPGIMPFNSAIAVRSGSVVTGMANIVPEPISSILFVGGAALLGFRRLKSA